MRTLYRTYDKSLVAALPRAIYDGRIEVVQSEGAALRAVDFLMRQPILGFDTETRPTFRRGPMHPVALLLGTLHGRFGEGAQPSGQPAYQSSAFLYER